MTLIRARQRSKVRSATMVMSGNWFKSRHSDDGGGCVEVALRTEIGVRDSKDPDGPELWFPGAAWQAFVDAVRDGLHDAP